MVSGLISALLVLGTAGLWFFGSYRRAMKRAHRAIQDSQKRITDAAEKDRARIEIELVGIESEIDGLMDPDDLASRVDAVFGGGEPVDGAESMPSDDAD